MELSKILKGALTLVAVGLVLLMLWYLRSVVGYIILSAVLAIVGQPLVERLTAIKIGGWNPSRTVAAGTTLLCMWVVIGGLGMLFIPLVVDKANELLTLDWNGVAESMREPLSKFENSINSLFLTPIIDVIKVIENLFKNIIGGDFVAAFTNVASSVVSIAIALFSVTFITFFFLRDSGLFYKIITLFFPERFHDNIQNALNSITTLLTRYFRGLFVESLIVMMVIAVSMTLFGMTLSNALITGLIMGTLNLIPYAGPVIGCLISMAMGMISPIDGEIGYTLIVIASTIACVKLIDDFIIQPTLYSKRVNAHPLEVFIVILISGHIGGVMGMLLAIPSYTVLRVIASEFFSEYAVVRRLTGNIKEQ